MKQLMIFFLLIAGQQTINAQNSRNDYHSARETYLKPNDIHEFLAQYSGEWTGEMSTWLYPQSSAQRLPLAVVDKMILGNRFMQMTINGTITGTPFECLITLGYSTTNQRFTTTNLDNLGTGTVTLTGYWVSPRKTIELFGDMPTPENTDVVHLRQLINFVDNDTYVIEYFDKRAGQQEFKNREFRFKRKK
ncbi:hypothetical protein DJ568_07595 [Mucilaginibacter hurinus]|uniref:DUF1579 domain-containing protein n=1 Tax=Mucilaginibacter hurinus TaxID=2201324 RepID=A0A367GQL0_9SPHI|nr:DUF1579 family protein [Mucilaginibacter hurinus]RCH55739.1 hypothetical protein DJ568_07595 [Mucilaginibacter hurinus]